MEVGMDAGDVFIAFSESGTQGSWDAINSSDPTPSELGMYQDADLVINAGTTDGFYRLLLTTDAGVDHFSEPFQIMGDLTPREYGITRAMLHQEYTQMRTTNGFPVWHCIPRAHGELAANVDPDTGVISGKGCEASPEDAAYGMKHKGGYYPPILTWMRVIHHQEGLQDDPEEFSTKESNKTSARLMAFPRPSRGHMLVDPTTDRRFLVGDEVKPFRLRGVIAVAYNVTLEFLQQRDERYEFPVPTLDTKAYRRIPYWNPSTLIT
tara:strand:- start:4912 stop:5706 length:795 start_codon:yes stop_codon:yes gene_type:complete